MRNPSNGAVSSPLSGVRNYIRFKIKGLRLSGMSAILLLVESCRHDDEGTSVVSDGSHMFPPGDKWSASPDTRRVWGADTSVTAPPSLFENT